MDADKRKAYDTAKRAHVAEVEGHNAVARDAWLKERLELMAREKEVMRITDDLAQQRRALPWLKVDKRYEFTGPEGRVTLHQLFRDKRQLFIKHFMMGPQQDWQCCGCTLEVDHMRDLLPHFENHDVAYVAVARAPIDEIERVRKKMGWNIRWVSSHGSSFNYDFHVSFTPEEIAAKKAIYNFREFDPEGSQDLSGNSVFYKNERGEIFLTYSAFGRGDEQFLGIYGFLDVLPLGREEYVRHSLPDWAQLRVDQIGR